MAGFFGLFDYNKPGKGVEKEERERHRFFVFFSVLSRKFLKLMQLNLIYVLFSLPYLLFLCWFSPVNLNMVMGIYIPDFSDYMQAMSLADRLNFDMLLRVVFAMSIITFWGAGPVSAGCGYVMRNLSRVEHTWIWSDFWDHMRENFKSGLVVLVVDIAAIYLFSVAFIFYSVQYAASKALAFAIFQGVLGIVLIIYTFMHYYIYQLMVTFADKLSRNYRNACIFALAKFAQNLLLTIIAMGIFIGAFAFLSLYTVFLCIVILIILCSFIITFYSSEAIRKISVTRDD